MSNDPIKDFIKGLKEKTTGRRPTAQEITDRNKERDERFARLSAKIPRISPGKLRFFFAKVREFDDFVQREHAEFLEVSATPEHAPRLLKLWLSDVAAKLEDDATSESDEDEDEDENSSSSDLSSVSILHRYRYEAQRMTFYMYPKPTEKERAGYADEIGQHVKQLIADQARKAAQAQEASRVMPVWFPYVKPSFTVTDDKQGKEMLKILEQLNIVGHPDFTLTELLPGEKILPPPERCQPGAERFLSEKLQELRPQIPDGLLREDGQFDLDPKRIDAIFQGFDKFLGDDETKKLYEQIMRDLMAGGPKGDEDKDGKRDGGGDEDEMEVGSKGQARDGEQGEIEDDYEDGVAEEERRAKRRRV
ncbi:uncharacterized protein I303_100201 [Kwoniella dejecticola CBS 10117]|uniref:Uncharacterized protein n=1 Tax=Kwoniella dejecticola CBS 10117 TaxID=1296121 RepID=A0A1A6AE86_9TREE|nr:uncharacterized protein I303_00204 [Kwoniella dejecticola CBS 10117]OBR88387.1 hypothetical protein I303_00204 [Kwoniella dejecticola CBS 10117]